MLVRLEKQEIAKVVGGGDGEVGPTGAPLGAHLEGQIPLSVGPAYSSHAFPLNSGGTISGTEGQKALTMFAASHDSGDLHDRTDDYAGQAGQQKSDGPRQVHSPGNPGAVSLDIAASASLARDSPPCATLIRSSPSTRLYNGTIFCSP